MNQELRGDSFLIVGLGREGKSTYQYLRTRHPSARIGLADRKELTQQEFKDLNAEVFSGPDYLSQAHTFDTIIRSPGVSLREILPHPSRDAHITSATNIFFAECPGKIIGVTGTKGKSTTSALTATLLTGVLSDVRLVGNIGTPMLDHLEGATNKTHFVIELSSYQLEDLRRSPHISILLNIVPEHLDYHGSFETYRAAKLNIARHQNLSDLLIINQASNLIPSDSPSYRAQRVFYAHNANADCLVSVCNDEIVIHSQKGKHSLLLTSQLPVKGPGNLQNALAAITCAVTLGVDIEHIRNALLAFKPLEHRLEFVAERSGIRFFNDSLSTIPEALNHAILALGPDVETIIAGGYDRGIDMTPIGPALAASQVKNLILFPTTGELIWNAAACAGHGKVYNRIDVQTMTEAVQAAYEYTSPGKICVMSPASSSFSVFRDYRDRGDQFKDAVRRLGRPHTSEALRPSS